MLGSSKLIALIGTARADACKTFYKDTLGLKLMGEDQFAIIFKVGDGAVRINKLPMVMPSAITVLGFEVKDIYAAVEALTGKGVQMQRFGMFPQDDKGVFTAPDGGKVAWFRDPDMNLLSVAQHAS
jgi:catechol 2,3-dioxygenase-like lactoylglutathione lyase family enzyme